ncbi:unnamed protein product [Orchesella dallaii]|uniref:Uncharacterized protein n=1 Tax=Orchesella dallaii TaxID=48710 RepID=A0ABP1PRE3_9HEXA
MWNWILGVRLCFVLDFPMVPKILAAEIQEAQPSLQTKMTSTRKLVLCLLVYNALHLVIQVCFENLLNGYTKKPMMPFGVKSKSRPI